MPLPFFFRGVCSACPTRLSRGVALPLVLLYAVAAYILVTGFLSAVLIQARPALRRGAEVQALANARSGIRAVIDVLVADTTAAASDSSAAVADTLFTSPDGLDSAVGFDPVVLLETGGPACLIPFADTAAGVCTLSLEPAGCFIAVRAHGVCRTRAVEARVLMGSRPFTHADTVMVLENQPRPEGGSINGDVVFVPAAADSTTRDIRRRFSFSRSRLDRFTSAVSTVFGSLLDSAIQDMPLVVTSVADLDDVPEKINGSLMINDPAGRIQTAAVRTLVVMGDVQITGEPDLGNVTIYAGGDIKIFDRSSLHSATLVARGRLFIQGRSVFGGTAVAFGNVEITDETTIVDKSVIVALGEGNKVKSTASASDSTTDAPPVTDKNVESLFSLYVRNRVRVDGALIAVSATHGISTDEQTVVHGILWSQAAIRHNGELKGALRARNTLGNHRDGQAPQGNILSGRVSGLEDIGDYILPFFIGVPAAVSWQETRGKAL